MNSTKRNNLKKL